MFLLSEIFGKPQESTSQRLHVRLITLDALDVDAPAVGRHSPDWLDDVATRRQTVRATCIPPGCSARDLRFFGFVTWNSFLPPSFDVVIPTAYGGIHRRVSAIRGTLERAFEGVLRQERADIFLKGASI